MIAEWIRRSPRLVAGVWFATAGFIPIALWFLPSVIRQSDLVAFVLVILLPTLVAGIGGSWIGGAILRRPRGGLRAVLRGMMVPLGSFVIFAPLYGIGSALTQPRTDGLIKQAIAQTYMVLFVGLIATGWVLAFVGGMAGLLLHLASRGTATKESSTTRSEP